MSRPKVILAAAVVLVIVVLVALSSINTEVAPVHVEKAVPNATLGR